MNLLPVNTGMIKEIHVGTASETVSYTDSLFEVKAPSYFRNLFLRCSLFPFINNSAYFFIFIKLAVNSEPVNS